MIEKTKFGLGIVCYENCEFLFDICYELREIADRIVVGWQTVSYSGKPLDESIQKEMRKEFAFLIENGFIDEMLIIENVYDGSVNIALRQLNEMNKRQKIYSHFVNNGLDYCLIVDSDEFHFGNDVKDSIKYLENHRDIDALYIPTKVFALNTSIVIENDKILYCNYTQRCKNSIAKFDYRVIENDEIRIDATRTFKTNNFEAVGDVLCYHFAYIRKDISNKLKNYSQPSIVQDNFNASEYDPENIEKVLEQGYIDVISMRLAIHKEEFPLLNEHLQKSKHARLEYGR